MNPKENKFEPVFQSSDLESALKQQTDKMQLLLRADGSPVPDHWLTLKQGEDVQIKDYLFTVAYIGEKVLVLEPKGPALGAQKESE